MSYIMSGVMEDLARLAVLEVGAGVGWLVGVQLCSLSSHFCFFLLASSNCSSFTSNNRTSSLFNSSTLTTHCYEWFHEKWDPVGAKCDIVKER